MGYVWRLVVVLVAASLVQSTWARGLTQTHKRSSTKTGNLAWISEINATYGEWIESGSRPIRYMRSVTITYGAVSEIQKIWTRDVYSDGVGTVSNLPIEGDDAYFILQYHIMGPQGVASSDITGFGGKTTLVITDEALSRSPDTADYIFTLSANNGHYTLREPFRAKQYYFEDHDEQDYQIRIFDLNVESFPAEGYVYMDPGVPVLLEWATTSTSERVNIQVEKTTFYVQDGHLRKKYAPLYERYFSWGGFDIELPENIEFIEYVNYIDNIYHTSLTMEMTPESDEDAGMYRVLIIRGTKIITLDIYLDMRQTHQEFTPHFRDGYVRLEECARYKDELELSGQLGLRRGSPNCVRCVAYGEDCSDILIKKGGEIVSSGDMKVLSSLSAYAHTIERTYAFLSPTDEDKGSYTCEVTKTTGDTTTREFTAIFPLPVTVDVPSSSSSATQFTLECSARGNPLPTVVFYRSDIWIADSPAEGPLTTGGTYVITHRTTGQDSVLYTLQVHESLEELGSDEFYCVASNFFDSAGSSFYHA